MDQDRRLHRPKPLPMRLSIQKPCPYIDGETEQRIAVDISVNPGAHDGVGSRRFQARGKLGLPSACPSCSACTPWRVDATAFHESRNMARITARNKDLRRENITGLKMNDSHYHALQILYYRST